MTAFLDRLGPDVSQLSNKNHKKETIDDVDIRFSHNPASKSNVYSNEDVESNKANKRNSDHFVQEIFELDSIEKTNEHSISNVYRQAELVHHSHLELIARCDFGSKLNSNHYEYITDCKDQYQTTLRLQKYAATMPIRRKTIRCKRDPRSKTLIIIRVKDTSIGFR